MKILYFSTKLQTLIHKNMKKGLLLLAIVSIFVLAGCGCHKKTEREQYESATSTLKYKSYKLVSKEVFPALFNAYNSKTPDSLKVREEFVHLLLGYFWMCSDKTTFGFAEGNIIVDKSDNDTFKSYARLMISIGMFENGWKDLAKEESAEGIKLLSKNPEGEYVKLELTVLQLVMGTYAVYSHDFEIAKFHFAGFATLTSIDWPYKLVDGMNDIEKGNTQTGLKKIKAMTTDETVPKEIRETLKTAIEEVEKKGGSVDSALFWPRVVSSVLYDELKKNAQPGMDGFMKVLDDLQKKLNDVI
jgi:hypothetical protein